MSKDLQSSIGKYAKQDKDNEDEVDPSSWELQLQLTSRKAIWSALYSNSKPIFGKPIKLKNYG